MASQFSPGEIRDILVAWIVFSVAISFGTILELGGSLASGAIVLVLGMVATATAFIFHELSHKFVAMRYGYVAHFKIWVWGIVLTLITAIGSGAFSFFGAPARSTEHQQQSDTMAMGITHQTTQFVTRKVRT